MYRFYQNLDDFKPSQTSKTAVTPWPQAWQSAVTLSKIQPFRVKWVDFASENFYRIGK
mgnify:CR=1 FL=1